MSNQVKVEEGGFTPALRQMAIELIDEIVARPVTSVISDPRNGAINTFQGIREKLAKKKYNLLNDWKNEVEAVFNASKNSSDPLVQDVANEISQYFNKKYAVLEEFSRFQFKTAISKIVDDIEQIQVKLENEKQ